VITLRDLTLRRGAKVVLDGAGFTLNPGEKAGLVGRNGAGKSSLFALLAGRLHADRGDVEVPPRWQVGEVAQSMPESDDGATDFVLAGDRPLVDARARLAAAEAADDGHAIAEAHLALEDAGAFDARARAQALLLGLGFRAEQLDAPVGSFSGGWRMRLQLARALMCPADLLLLDEPTNHLDLDALVWLESWLQRFAGTLIVISHDREFLDAVTQVTLHVEDGRLTRYGGNYSAFETMRAERLSQAASAYAKQQERIAQLQRFIDRFRAKATKARQAQSRVKALDRMERLAPVLTAGDFAFEFREPASLPNPMLVLKDVTAGYGSTPVSRSATSRSTRWICSRPTTRRSSAWCGWRARCRRRRASRICATSSASSASRATWCTRGSARSRAASVPASCSRRSSGSARTCCCSTSRPTTSTSPRARRCR
jgi:ATP-binding cassette subfamily F protein 3